MQKYLHLRARARPKLRMILNVDGLLRISLVNKAYFCCSCASTYSLSLRWCLAIFVIE